MTLTATLLAAAIGYLLGAIPFGFILTRLAGHGDIRNIGSGNIGATNVLRTGSKTLAAATLVLDCLKGAAAVLIVAALTTPTPDAAPLSWTPTHTAAATAFLGHLFPVWLGFRGGKGVATYIGILVGLAWPLAIAFCCIWLTVAAASRYSSLSALLAAVLISCAGFYVTTPVSAFLIMMISVLLILKHHDNIRRLRAGEEPKIGEDKQSAT